jgi:hypothetical protein
MPTVKIGDQDVTIGAPSVAGYVVQSVTDPAGADIDMEDIIDHSTGQLVTRLVHQVHPKINLTLITTDGTPASDFPIGSLATIGSTEYFIDDCQVENTRGGQRVTVSATNIGLTTPSP